MMKRYFVKSAIIPIPGRPIMKPRPLASHSELIDQMSKNKKLQNNSLKFKEKYLGPNESNLLQVAFTNYHHFESFYLQFFNCDIEAIALESILSPLSDKRSLKRMSFDFSGSTFDDQSANVFHHYLKHLPSLEKVTWNFSDIRGSKSLIPKIINGFWEHASQPKNLNMSINLSGAELSLTDLETIFWMLKIVSTTKRKNPRMPQYYSSLSIGQFKLILSSCILESDIPYNLKSNLSKFSGLNLDTLCFDFSSSRIDNEFSLLISSFFKHAYSRNSMFLSFSKTKISIANLSNIIINACLSSIVGSIINLSEQELSTEGWLGLAHGIDHSNQLIDMKLILKNIKITRIELTSLLLSILKNSKKSPSLAGFLLDLSGVFLENDHISLVTQIIQTSSNLNKSSFSFNLYSISKIIFENFLKVLCYQNKEIRIRNFSLTIGNGSQDFDAFDSILDFISNTDNFNNFNLNLISLPIHFEHIQKLANIFNHHSNLSGLKIIFQNCDFPVEYGDILIEGLKRYVLRGNLLINFSISLQIDEINLENTVFDIDLYDSTNPFKLSLTDPLLPLMSFSLFDPQIYPSWVYKLYFRKHLSEEDFDLIEKYCENLFLNPTSLPIDLQNSISVFLTFALIDKFLKKDRKFGIAIKDYLKRILSQNSPYGFPSDLKIAFLKQFILIHPQLAKFCMYEIRKEDQILSLILPITELRQLILQIFLQSLHHDEWQFVQSIFHHEITTCFDLTIKRSSINEKATFSKLQCSFEDHRIFDILLRHFEEVCQFDEFQKIYKYPSENYRHLLYLLSNLNVSHYSNEMQKKMINGLTLLFDYPYNVILEKSDILSKLLAEEITFKQSLDFLKSPFEKNEEISEMKVYKKSTTL